MKDKGPQLRCPWCLECDVEAVLLYEAESDVYRCARCCFFGTKERVEDLYLALSAKAAPIASKK